MVIMISHNIEIASMFADKVILMGSPGTVVEVGTANDFLTEDNLRMIYDVKCTVVSHEGRPQMLFCRGD